MGNEVSLGLCQCGCGEVPPIAKQTDKKRGYVKGRPVSFVFNHHLRNKTGVSNSQWKGGRVINFQGYVLIYKPLHPRAVKGYVLEHTLVLEEVLGRPILPTETGHHINGDKTDNSPGNLILFATKAMHTAFHQRLKAFEACDHWDWRQCWICHRYDGIENLYINPAAQNAYHQDCRKIANARRS
jgi:hypothetical protein